MKDALINNTIREEKLLKVLEQFIFDKRAEGCSSATLKTYQVHLNRFINCIYPNKEDVYINEITKKEYNDFILYLQGTDVSGATVNSYCLTLRCFLNYCFTNGYIKKFPCKIPKYQGKIKKIYTETELIKLLKKPDLKHCTFGEYKTWLMENIAIATGLRIGSILNIKIEDIDFNENSFDINTTKNKNAFKTYFNKDLSRMIKEYLMYRGGNDGDFLICTNKGEQLSIKAAQDHIRNYNLKRGVTKTSLHLFRHTFAKNSILAGMDVFTLMRKLQHNDITTTLNYVKMLNLDIKNSVDLYNPQKLYHANNQKIRMKKQGETK